MHDAAEVALKDGTKAYELRDLDVHEFSYVIVGANHDISITVVKSAPAHRPRFARARATLALLRGEQDLAPPCRGVGHN
ncbi:MULTISPECIES: hypothetical protein [Microbacterium]|uniref:Uncharacterized protein n=1 Tax=Microbacterium aurugineum TaxID=2851642 RepID=A0ABY4IXY0_9MICO|nr:MULTISPECIES: hypothetical protein [Microbacterium]MCZ4300962.1 hypothetical protein [Microbacterium oxydans]UPL17627.1 hypothetical protein KV397_07610 [Microbacterium aurugineum]